MRRIVLGPDTGGTMSAGGRPTISVRVTAFLAALALIVGLVWVVGGTTAGATGTLDQSQTTLGVDAGDWISIPGPDSGSAVTAAQTFTAGLSGLLDQVDLHIGTSGTATDALTVQIRDVSNGEPGTTVLATSSLAAPSSSTRTWHSVAFSSPATITSGTAYAIVAFPASGSSEYAWSLSGSGSDPYANGVAFWRDDTASQPPWDDFFEQDTGFKTYVSPAGADLAVDLTAPSSAETRTSFTYTATIDNAGTETAANVALTMPLPYGVQYLSSTASQGSCTPPGRAVQLVTCALSSITDGSDATVGITVKVTAGAGKGYLNGLVSVNSDTSDPETSGNEDSTSTEVTR